MKLTSKTIHSGTYENSEKIFGYSGKNAYGFNLSCTGSESSLKNCQCYRSLLETEKNITGVSCINGTSNMHSHKAFLVLLYHYACIFVSCKDSTSSIFCSKNGSTRLTLGITNDQGVLEYCYNGRWSVFCNLDDEEAEVACKQMGYSQFGGNIRQLVYYTSIIHCFSH